MAPGLMVDVSRAEATTAGSIPAVVVDLLPALTIKFIRAVPDWCTDGEQLVLECDHDGQQRCWSAEVDIVDPETHLVQLTSLTQCQLDGGDEADQAVSPFRVEWSPIDGGPRHLGVGRHLSRLGLSFVPAGTRPTPGQRVVVAVQFAAGSISAQAEVVAVDDDLVRLELTRAHPQALARLADWEAERRHTELADNLLDMVAERQAVDGIDDDPVGAQPS